MRVKVIPEKEARLYRDGKARGEAYIPRTSK